MSWGAVIGAVGVVGAAYVGSSGARKAAGTADAQAQVTWDIYRQNRKDLLPFLEAGKEALDKYETGDITEEYISQLMSLTFPEGVDPTGGVQKYIDEIETMDFKFDPNDAVYKWRSSENERIVNQFMASRGGYDSRAAANMLLSSGMELQSQEVDRQFNQRYLTKYNRLLDLSRLSLQKGATEYGAAKEKYASDVGKAGQAYSSRENQLLNLIKAGQGAAGTLTSAGQGATNALAAISQDKQNAILQQSAIGANLLSGLGSMPAYWQLYNNRTTGTTNAFAKPGTYVPYKG